MGARDILHRDVEQESVFAAECSDDAGVQGAHGLRPWPAACYLGKELGQRNDVAEAFGGPWLHGSARSASVSTLLSSPR